MTLYHSPLRFEISGLINIIYGEDIPDAIFRDCGSRASVLNGNIWFTGPTQNQLLHERPDIYEYRNPKNSSFLHEYVSSWTDKKPTENLDHCVQIVGKEKILQSSHFISRALQDQNLIQKVSWIALNEIIYRKNTISKKNFSSDEMYRTYLKECEKFIALSYELEKYPPAENETQLLYVVGFRIEKANYVYKYAVPISKNGRYNSRELAANAQGKNDEFSAEKEVRIALNTSSFFKNPLLHRYVKHLQITCPELSKICEPCTDVKKEILLI